MSNHIMLQRKCLILLRKSGGPKNLAISRAYPLVTAPFVEEAIAETICHIVIFKREDEGTINDLAILNQSDDNLLNVASSLKGVPRILADIFTIINIKGEAFDGSGDEHGLKRAHNVFSLFMPLL